MIELISNEHLEESKGGGLSVSMQSPGVNGRAQEATNHFNVGLD